MIKIIISSKKIFHILLLLLIVISLYPGSILGYVMHGNIKEQPNIFDDYSNISLNHFYTYLVISLLGFFSYYKEKKLNLVVFLMFFLAIILEVSHLKIPTRAFETPDLLGNILGVLLPFVLVLILKFWRKK